MSTILCRSPLLSQYYITANGVKRRTLVFVSQSCHLSGRVSKMCAWMLYAKLLSRRVRMYVCEYLCVSVEDACVFIVTKTSLKLIPPCNLTSREDHLRFIFLCKKHNTNRKNLKYNAQIAVKCPILICFQCGRQTSLLCIAAMGQRIITIHIPSYVCNFMDCLTGIAGSV